MLLFLCDGTLVPFCDGCLDVILCELITARQVSDVEFDELSRVVPS